MKIIRFWLPVVLWMAIIFLFSTRQKVQISDQGAINFLFFKSLHVLEYAMLYLLTYRAVRNTADQKSKKLWYVLAFVIAVVYAMTDEIHQTLVPTRQGQPRDVIIDAAGATFAWLTINQLLPKAPKKLQHWAKQWQVLT